MLTSFTKKFAVYLKLSCKPAFWTLLWNYWLAVNEMVSHKYETAIKRLTLCLKLVDHIEDFKITILGLIYEHLGKCYFGINDIAKSKFYLLKALEFFGDENKMNSEVASRLGFICYDEGETQKAKHYLEIAKARYKKVDYTNIKAVNQYLSKF